MLRVWRRIGASMFRCASLRVTCSCEVCSDTVHSLHGHDTSAVIEVYMLPMRALERIQVGAARVRKAGSYSQGIHARLSVRIKR
jgi:hypothetical protein